MKIASKLPQVGTNIFTIMSQMATDYGAINLGQGFPDFSPDPALLSHVNDAMQEGYNQYPPMAGIPELRQAIADKVQALYGHTYDPSTEVTVTSGATEALMSTILALVHPGDEVIVIEPFYDVYLPAIELAGGKPVVVSMDPPTESNAQYSVDWQKVRDAISARTRLLILNFPHNPTGITLKPSDLDALEQITQETGIYLLCDEVYEHIVFTSTGHLSISTRPQLAERAVVVSSFGKTYHTTGWKVGYCTAPAALMNEVRKVHQFIVFTVSSPMQVAIARYMQNPEPYLQLSEFYRSRHDYLLNALSGTRFQPIASQGTFFLLASYAEISDLPEAEFATWMTREHGVTVIPVAAFYQDPLSTSSNHQLVRFCFAKQNATLETAVQRLAQI